MLQLSYMLVFVALSYGQQSTSNVSNSNLHSVLIDLIPSATQKDGKLLEKVTPTIPKTDFELVTKRTDSSTTDSEPERCSDGEITDGFCVPYYRCSYTSLTTKPPLDLAFAEYACMTFYDVCCPLLNVMDNPTVTSDVIGEQTKVNISCGHRNPKGVTGLSLMTDNESSFSAFGEFPWTVAILRTESVSGKESTEEKLNVYLGGGSLIHPSIVLTGAHVAAKHKELRIRAGEWDTQTTKEVYPHQDRAVKEVLLYPDFMPKNLHNDIALLFLTSPVDMSLPHIGVACLPNDNVVDYSSKAMCLASGWGKDQFGVEGRYSVTLKKVELPLVGQESCEGQLRQTRLGTHFELDPSFLCAGGELGRDTCVGDGGAPLVCPVKDAVNKYVQAGIVAWGINCGAAGVPAVYVNVAKFRKWIDYNVIMRGYETEIYTI